MAINKKNTTIELINIFIENSIFLKDYESTERILKNEEHSYNLAKKVASKISNAVKLLLSNEEGITEFVKLLDNENIVVSASAAEYLYPLYPQKCLKILKKYSKSLSNKLDSHKIDWKIEGFKQNQQFFIDIFKKIYGCDNLETLNREDDLLTAILKRFRNPKNVRWSIRRNYNMAMKGLIMKKTIDNQIQELNHH